MGNSDQVTREHTRKAARAPAYHSAISEHFQDDFPLFMNRWVEGFELREHHHAYLEIVYVMSGEGYHHVGDTVERAAKGSIYILPVGTSHIMRPSDASPKGKLLVYNLCIRPEFIEELKTWLSRHGDGAEALRLYDGSPGTYITLVDQGLELCPWFERLHREFTEKPLGYEASMFAGLLQISVQITRLVNRQAPSTETVVTAGLARTGMTAIMEYIDLHMAEALTVELLAEKAGMSRRHFIRLFQHSAGRGFSDYLQHRRVELACRLLHETDYKITYIAKQAGYQDPAHFREVFRRIMGTTPNQYRKGI